jgi:acetylornithine deacetylase/succinyl-diaminopimelate desuccinylase-like protein
MLLPLFLALAQSPEVLQSWAHIDAQQEAIQAEWIQLTEIEAPSKQEEKRIAYMKKAMARVGLSNIEQDELGNVWGVYKGTGGGPEVVFAAHMDTVFPLGTRIKVREEKGRYHAPSISDDTGALVALLHAFDAMRKNGVTTKGDVVFLATVQEEIGLYGARHWLQQRAKKPDMFLAVDSRLGGVSYGALRIEQYRFVFEHPAMHTLASRGRPSTTRAAARAIQSIYELPLPAQPLNLPVVNVGTLGGGSVTNATPASVFFTADIRSLDTPTEAKLVEDVKTAAQRAANQEGVQLKIEAINEPLDYSKALPREERLNHTLVKTVVAVTDQMKLNGDRKTVPADMGSDDHNAAVALGIPSVGIGAIAGAGAHSLEESADKASIVPGAKYMILLAATLANL